jgi:RNA polymerase sigma-70 factor, ECF subfamily
VSEVTIVLLLTSHIDDSAADPLPRVPAREAGPPVDERALVRRLAAGDETALTVITDWLWTPLAAFAYRLVEDRDIATDIAQEALVRLWERRGRELQRSLRAFLFQVTRNLALDHLKSRRTRERLLNARESGYATAPAEPDEMLEREHLRERVQRAIQELPERRREVFSLTYLQGFSYAEVGEIMGISPKTVHNQMSAALSQLRETLRPLLAERSATRSAPEAKANDAQ